MSSSARLDSSRRPTGLFSGGQVRRIVGCCISSLDYWIRARIVTPQIQATGRQTDRWYNNEDLVAVRIAALTSQLGLREEYRRKIVTAFRNHPTLSILRIEIAEGVEVRLIINTIWKAMEPEIARERATASKATCETPHRDTGPAIDDLGSPKGKDGSA
jgi:hypothetical protein